MLCTPRERITHSLKPLVCLWPQSAGDEGASACEHERERTRRRREDKERKERKERKGKERKEKRRRETLYKLTTCNHGAERPELEDCDERGVGTRAVEAGSR